MARNDLFRQLVASPHPLPAAQPRALTVAPQRALPPQVRFGPANPPQLGRSGFSGALVGAPMNVVHPQAPASYSSPVYAPLQGTAPGARPFLSSLAPLIAAIATGATGGGGGGGATAPTGGIGMPPPPPHTLAAPGQFPLAPRTGDVTRSVAPAGEFPTARTAFPDTSSALIAALAQIGQKLGTARSAPAYY